MAVIRRDKKAVIYIVYIIIIVMYRNLEHKYRLLPFFVEAKSFEIWSSSGVCLFNCHKLSDHALVRLRAANSLLKDF